MGVFRGEGSWLGMGRERRGGGSVMGAKRSLLCSECTKRCRETSRPIGEFST
jgi:hypothetical protein